MPFATAWRTTPTASWTGLVVTETDADFCPLGTVTDAGSIAAAASDESCTAYPPLGALPESVTVAIRVPPPTTLERFNVKPLSATRVTARSAVAAAPP